MNAPFPDSHCCLLCGGARFGPGPNGRLLADGAGPLCLQCGSLERHRAIAAALGQMHPHYRSGRRVLLVSPEPFDLRPWFSQVSTLAAARHAALEPALAGYGYGVFDVIVVVYILEFQDDDQGAIQSLLRLLTPEGVLLACLMDAQARPWTSIALGPAGSLRRYYGRDVASHFHCQESDFQLNVWQARDSATGQDVALHCFHRQQAARSLPAEDVCC